MASIRQCADFLICTDDRNLDSRYELIGEGNLMITRTEESDRGTYQCRAENREDSADVSAVLDVYGMLLQCVHESELHSSMLIMLITFSHSSSIINSNYQFLRLRKRGR